MQQGTDDPMSPTKPHQPSPPVHNLLVTLTPMVKVKTSLIPGGAHCLQ